MPIRPIVAALALTVGFVVGAAAPPPAHAQQPAVVVEMSDDLNFEPAQITVRAGDTVEWRNVGRVPHTVTADAEEAADPANVQLPEGAEPFDSGSIPAGETFQHTFEVPGQYRYFCIPHEAQGMIGEVTVEP